MGNLLRMDLYRMTKAKSFWVCLGIAFGLALLQTPFLWGISLLSRMLSSEVPAFPKTALLSGIIADPFPLLNGMLCLLSACSFFYADVENGYIKNIAGQMPKRGFTILSKFLAAVPHTLLFMLAGVVGNLIGTVIFQRIVPDGEVMNGVLSFVMRLLLMQSICAILLLVTSSFQNKSLGTVLAVLMGLGLLYVVYSIIDSGINQLWQNKGFAIADYMPAQLLSRPKPPVPDSILVSAVTTAIFLPLSIRVFDRRDVK